MKTWIRIRIRIYHSPRSLNTYGSEARSEKTAFVSILIVIVIQNCLRVAIRQNSARKMSYSPFSAVLFVGKSISTDRPPPPFSKPEYFLKQKPANRIKKIFISPHEPKAQSQTWSNNKKTFNFLDPHLFIKTTSPDD
jgi:hypothetical protein